jgi:hypothetical protein
MLENDRLKPYFLQIDLENMILATKNIRMISLVDITLEFRTGPRFMPARPCSMRTCSLSECLLVCQIRALIFSLPSIPSSYRP